MFSRLVHIRRRIGAAAVAGCLLALALAGPAAADSLVFVKDNNVWLASPDGGNQVQVTSDGTADNPYRSPSQADDGTIVAARKQPNGGPLYRLAQNGELLGTIPVGPMLAGPFAPQVSPDGRTVAFEHVFSRSVNGYLETSSDVRFTRTDGSTPNGFGEVGRGAGAPSWIDSGRAFVGINSIATTVSPGSGAEEWWSDYDHQPAYFSFGETVEDGEVAPNGNVAVVRGEHDDNTIQLYRSTGGFTSLPKPTCTLMEPSAGPAGKMFVDPTFSPSGDAIAWQEGNGVWAESLPENCADGEPHLLIAGASEPDWGPAAVNPGPRKSAAGTAGGASAGRAGRSKLTATVLTASISKALAKGLKVRLEAPGAGRVSGGAKLRAKPVASGSRQLKGAGATTLVLRFSKDGRRKLAGAEQAKLKVKVRLRPAGGGAELSRGLTVTLKG